MPNGGVRSPRDNVASAPRGLAAEARAETATASSEVVGNQEGAVGSTQVKCRKGRDVQQAKAVPLCRTQKLLSGLDQKVRGQVPGFNGPRPQMSRHRPRDPT